MNTGWKTHLRRQARRDKYKEQQVAGHSLRRQEMLGSAGCYI
jgi:hypothetical protein